MNTVAWRRPDQRSQASGSERLAIEAHCLTTTCPSGVRALDGVSLRVKAGTMFGLLGPNGAGKSTIVKVLTTRSRAHGGTARIAGYDVAREPDRVRRTIGAVGQQSAVDSEATGRENLLLRGRLYDMGGRGLRRRTDELLEHFGLIDVADLPAQYSTIVTHSAWPIQYPRCPRSRLATARLRCAP